MSYRVNGHRFRSSGARTDAWSQIDLPRLPVAVDHFLRPRSTPVWARPRAANFHCQIWRLDAVGNDGFLSGRDGRFTSVTATHHADFGLDRRLRGAVQACSRPLARRVSTDDGGRAAAGPRLLAMGYARLWR